MNRILAPLLAVVFALCTHGALAQSTYVQIEAKRTLDEAETAARIYARDFPNVAAFALPSGWYAIAVGPYSEGQAADRLAALLSERLIPADSFLADAGRFVRQVYPEGGALAEAAPVATTDVDTDVAMTEEVAQPDPARIPDETPREARANEAALDGPARELVQTALAFEGFYTATIDGDFGPGTRKSMAAWQTARGYEETGILTTAQRVELLNDYQSVVNAFSFQIVRDDAAGIEMKVPAGLVQKGRVDPPFANYDPTNNSGVRLLMISQSGDKATLYGLYDILQTLDIMPLDGERAKADNSFFINGKNDKIASHAEAKLTADGIKGFILVWPAGDDRKFAYALRKMQESFTVIDGSVLPDVVSEGGIQDPDLLSGLEIRRPDVTRSGFYVDATGLVLTTTDVTGECTRLTLDDGITMSVVAADPASGLALLKADRKMAPLAFARFRAAAPRLKSDVAVSGFAYDGRLGAPVLTFGKIEDVKGLGGEADLDRLTLSATPSDAGGPVFDSTGAVFGVLLPTKAQTGQVLPGDVAFARDFAAISGFLTTAGLTPVMAEGADDMPPEVLTRHAADMTVRLACWN